MQPRAIETRYKGYRFRSRLEARWAVFFDALGLTWEYEPEGFELPGGVRYLPDFKVTSIQGLVTWYEVKPKVTRRDSKFDLFLEVIHPGGGYETEATAELLSGDPVDVLERGAHVCPRCGMVYNRLEVYDFGDEMGVNCFPCDYDTPSGGGNPKERGHMADVQPHKGSLLISYADWAKVKNKVKNAATVARGARFEHGESGAKA